MYEIFQWSGWFKETQNLLYYYIAVSFEEIKTVLNVKRLYGPRKHGSFFPEPFYSRALGCVWLYLYLPNGPMGTPVPRSVRSSDLMGGYIDVLYRHSIHT